MTIWKFPLEVMDTQIIRLPIGAKILTVQMQNAVCNLWAIVDETITEVESRTINIYGTGFPLPEDVGTYLNTFQMMSGGLVFHVFEA